MDTALIVGVDTIIGSNLAACLGQRARVVGLSQTATVEIDGCETHAGVDHEIGAIRQRTLSVRPDWIVYCGKESLSSWQHDGSQLSRTADVELAESWAAVANETGCRFAMISSDAVFTGPWMFHTEKSGCFCPSEAAETIRLAERNVAAACPGALIVRTNAYGWSPAGVAGGWIETLVDRLEEGRLGTLDCVRHATPILATDLASALIAAFERELHGIYHIAGAERVNPARFVQELALAFDLPFPARANVGSLSERPAGFGQGETSLHTRKIRKTLDISMPLLSEGLSRLASQSKDGYRELLNGSSLPSQERVA